MSLTKDHTTSFSFYGNMLEADSSVQFPHISPYDFDNYIQNQDKDGLDSPTKSKNTPPLSSSSSANSSNGLGIHQHASSYDQPHEEAHSLINFKTGFESFYHSGGSLLNFQQVVDQTNNDTSYPKLSHSSDHHYQIWEDSNSSINQLQVRLLDQVNCLQTTSGGYKDATNEWFYAEAAVADPPQESGTQETCFNKRPPMEEEDMQAVKKQCTTSASKKPAKPKSSTSKDPQSIAAKNRRERISERLKILQDLVPNGSKVDLVTMLEKAISYVKFLQLQVEVLANDELWPAAGGKSLNISQVREAIDVILSSHRSKIRA